VARSGASVLMITQSSSEQNICFVVGTADTRGVVRELEGELQLELMRGDLDRVQSQGDVAIIAVVGAGLMGRPGIASQVFGSLADADINVISIAQGSSEYNLSLVVAHDDVDEGVRAIHRQFGLDRI
jgi:aspartate kinase